MGTFTNNNHLMTMKYKIPSVAFERTGTFSTQNLNSAIAATQPVKRKKL